MFVHISHYLSLLIRCVELLHVQIVKLHEVLLELRLAKEVVDAEVDPLLSVVFRGAHQLYSVVNKVDFGLRLAEVACNGRLETLGVHIMFKF